MAGLKVMGKQSPKFRADNYFIARIFPENQTGEIRILAHLSGRPPAHRASTGGVAEMLAQHLLEFFGEGLVR